MRNKKSLILLIVSVMPNKKSLILLIVSVMPNKKSLILLIVSVMPNKKSLILLIVSVMPNKKSSIWQYFDKVGEYHVRCNDCRTVLKITRGSTSPMWLHARRQHSITNCIPQPKTFRKFSTVVRIQANHMKEEVV